MSWPWPHPPRFWPKRKRPVPDLAGRRLVAIGEGESWTEEFWTHPRAGMMIGASREGRGETLRTWESIRILRTAEGSLAYIPMPNGGAPVEFAMTDQGARSIEFANPAHDFPQRIRYWREGDTLHAEIALIDGSRAIQWSYSPMGG